MVKNLIRGGVAIIVGYLVALLAHLGFHVSHAMEATWIGVITAAAGTLYLHLVAELEKRYPWVGWLLGVRKPGPGGQGGSGGNGPAAGTKAPSSPASAKA